MNIDLGRVELMRSDGLRVENRSSTRRSPSSSRLRIRVLAWLGCLDLGSILCGFSAAALMFQHAFNDQNWVLVVAVFVPIYFFTALNLHAYAAENQFDPFRAAAKAVQTMLLTIMSFVFVAFCFKISTTLPRMITTGGWIFATTLIASARYFFVSNLARVVGGNPFCVVLICDGDYPVPVGNFSMTIASEGFFDPDKHDPLMYHRLSSTLREAERVVVACPPERRMTWALALKGANIRSEIIIPELHYLAPLAIGHGCGSEPTVVVATGPLKVFDRMMKRGFDITVASLALVVLSPILVAVAIAIKLETRGPVLFKQTRIGQGNHHFRILKFRSMRHEASDSNANKLVCRNDDRVTRIGKFIRKASIDELPQLINVIEGDMSIVGPRPHALGARAAEKLYWDVDQRYWHRHAAKPGLTGLAQVRGYRGNTEREEDLTNRLQADLEYLESWSVWRDIKIVVLTFRVIFHPNSF